MCLIEQRFARIPVSLFVLPAPPDAQVYYLGLMHLNRSFYCFLNRGNADGQRYARQEHRHIPVDARNSHAIVSSRSNNSGNVSTVRVTRAVICPWFHDVVEKVNVISVKPSIYH